MLKWLAGLYDHNMTDAYENNSVIYRVTYFSQYNYHGALSIRTGKWLPENLRPMDKHRGSIIYLPDCQFATKEQAMAICERHYRRLLLQ